MTTIIFKTATNDGKREVEVKAAISPYIPGTYDSPPEPPYAEVYEIRWSDGYNKGKELTEDQLVRRFGGEWMYDLADEAMEHFAKSVQARRDLAVNAKILEAKEERQ